MGLEFSRWIFEKSSNIKFHENPSSGSRIVPCRWTDRQTDRQKERKKDRQTDMMKLPVTVCNSANVLEKGINEKQYSRK